MNAIEHLEKWTHPDSYAGHSPVGDYVIYSRNRDSSILENSNYELILADLLALAKTLETEDSEPFVYDFRASHWAVGWVECIIVSADSPDKLLITAGEIVCSLSDYPVYNEDKYSQCCTDEIVNYWEQCSLKERISYCTDAGLSVFAARGFPGEIFDRLSDEIY